MSEFDEDIWTPRKRMQKIRLITWKDADQNLCALAAYMLQEADRALRTDLTQSGAHEVDGGGYVHPGFARDAHAPVNVGWWSRGWNENNVEVPVETTGTTVSQDNRFLSACCWWSFKNIILRRLTQARLEIAKNLLPQSRRLHYEKKNRTRNETGRKKWTSKFGRLPER